MGEGSGIGWTGNTANFWWGCSEIADPTMPDGLNPACADCYAREWAARLGKAQWGDAVPRVRMPNASKQVMLWNRKAAADPNYNRRTFVQSMSDFFENRADVEPWRAEGWATIKKTQNLQYQLLTKRTGGVERGMPDDWKPGSNAGYEHVGLMFTVVTKRDAARDVPRLLRLKEKYKFTWVGLSIEPLHEPFLLEPYWFQPGDVLSRPEPPYLDWVIIGGKSQRDKDKLRAQAPYDMNAALALIHQCQDTRTAVYHKQVGSKAIYNGQPWRTDHWKGEVPDQWPEEFRVQQFPPALLAPLQQPQEALL